MNKFKLLNGFLVWSILVIALCPFVQGHAIGASGPAHQYISKEAGNTWSFMPQEMKQYTQKSIDYHFYRTWDTSQGPVDFRPLNPWCYDNGDDIVVGSAEEDICTFTGGPIDGFRNHYWDSDQPQGGDYSKTIVDSEFDYYYLLTGINLWLSIGARSTNSQSNFEHAKYIWNEKVIKSYLRGDVDESYYYLGRVAHLLEDASVPAHMNSDIHINNEIAGDDSYEAFIADVQDSFPDTAGKSNFYHWNGSNYKGQEYDYEDIDALFTKQQWSDINPHTSKISYPSDFFKLFWYTAQKTQYYASDDVELIKGGEL